MQHIDYKAAALAIMSENCNGVITIAAFDLANKHLNVVSELMLDDEDGTVVDAQNFLKAFERALNGLKLNN